MNGEQLDDFLKRDPYTRRAYRGVYSSDALPTINLAFPAALVINTDVSGGEGEHWVALYIDPWRVGTYFDSYGLPPMQRTIQTFLDEHAFKRWTFSTRSIQGALSSHCGIYCLYFLHHAAQGVSLDALSRPFDPYTWLRNDFVVNDWYQRRRRMGMSNISL